MIAKAIRNQINAENANKEKTMSGEPTTLSNTLLGFGLFCMATAIVGGGLKAFGFELGPLASVRRQVILFVFGAILVAVSGEKTIVSAWLKFFPYPTVVEAFDPVNIGPGQVRSFSLKRMHHDGPVEATIESIQSDPPGKEVQVSVCSAEKPGDCKNEQLGAGRSISDTLPAGDSVINVFSFQSNPPVTVSLKVEHTE